MRKFAATIVLVAAATLVPLGGSPQASAGARCTVVGTPGADTLRGTRGRDVICGRGGDDYLIGRAGDDVLLGGPGSDRVRGGPGADLARGARGGDVLDGQGGEDLLLAGGGADHLTAGRSSDVLRGGPGNDDLDGGPRPDHLDGGDGFNTCTLDATDVAEQCAYDLASAELVETEFSVGEIDVTHADREVAVRLHVTDDTGAELVYIQHGYDGAGFPVGQAHLVSGTSRDGWWETTLTFPQYSRPGTYRPIIRMVDRLERWSNAETVPAVEVRDDNPDLEQPQVVELQTPDPDQIFDFRDGTVPVTVRAHVTDALSGAETVHASLQYRMPSGERFYTGTSMSLIDGTATDGIWQAVIRLDPEDAWSGTWSLVIGTVDHAHLAAQDPLSWAGPTAMTMPTVGDVPIPEGKGDIGIIGREITDHDAPTLGRVTLAASEVDTLAGPQRVALELDAQDIGTGVRYVSVELNNPDVSFRGYDGDVELTSGTRADGTWSGHVDLPQGAPPGTYYLEARIGDLEFNTSNWIAANAPDTHGWNLIVSNPTVTVVDHG